MKKKLLLFLLVAGIINGENLITKPFFTEREKVIESVLYQDSKSLNIFLKNYKYDLKKVKVLGKTALQYAFENGCDMKKIYLLAQAGADLNQNFKNDYYTPIHYVIYSKKCHKNNFEVLRFLIKNEADVDKKNCYDITPLQMAVEFNSLASAELLLINKANIYLPTKTDTPLIFSLINREENQNFKTVNDELLMANLLFKYGIEQDKKYKDSTLLSLALSVSKNDLAKYLIFKGADLNPQTSNRSNIPLISALLVGLHRDNLDMVKALINYGADIKELNKPLTDFSNSQPPLILTLIYKRYKLAKYLIENGIDTNPKDSDVIFWAKDNRPIYNLLKKYGAVEKEE